MKLSLNWIKDYVKLPEDMDLSRLAYDLTMSTVEVEGAVDLAKQFDGLVVGTLLEVNPHPNADKLRVCKTDIGDQIVEIVCGGINLAPGMKVAVALPGAMVRWHGEGEPVEIKKSKLRGVESYGMICASSEIGLGDLLPASQEAEIVDLSAFDAPAGTPLAKALDLEDIILEIDNKSMTNRPDLWGHYGIARELAALYDLPLAEIPAFTAENAGDFEVEIADPDKCPRYIGVAIDGVAVKPSPYQMQSRIWRVGMRPINALVDITNYVMLAVGQPTHAFDADQIKGHITVRSAAEGEKLSLLNGKDLTLSAADLVIADEVEAVALAGVMGGSKDSILPETSRVILEVANFDSRSIRGTALRYDNRTEASSRYEKAVDPQRCDLALSLAMKYFAELYPELKVTGFKDNYPKPLTCCELDVSLDWLTHRLGKTIENEVIAKKLGSLGFTVTFDGDIMHLVVPSWRSTGDVNIKDDVMEEVARMYGYENFEPTPIVTSFEGAINQIEVDLPRKLKEFLAFRCGMQEIFTYPWMQDTFVNAILQSTDGVLALSTPPSPDEKYLRSSLLPNICAAVMKNERYYSEFALFEEAQVFFDRDYTAPYDTSELLPRQERHLGGAFAGSADQASVTALFRKAKGVLETMPRYTHMEGFTFKKAEKPVWADEVVWLNICLNDAIIGSLALLSKKASMACGIKNLAVMLFELNIDALKPFRSRTNGYEHLAEFPMVEYDVSLLFDASTKWSEIETAIMAKADRKLLHKVAFVDEYRGKQVPDGKKSVTLRLTIGSAEKTLKSEEIESIANTAIKRLSKTLGGEMRTK